MKSQVVAGIVRILDTPRQQLKERPTLAWTRQPAARSGGRQQDGHPERPAIEDEAFLDHHIEETLRTMSDTVRLRASDVDGEEQASE
jgi:hypothetical protein